MRHNSLEIVDAIASLARDSDDGDELVLNIRRNMVSEIDYRIMKIDLDTGKTLAETPAPRRPVKIRMSPDGNYLACHYTSYYDLQRDEEDDQVVIMKAEDLSTVGSIGREFVSDLCFDRSDRILICGFGQKPAQGDKAVYGKVDFIDNGSRSLFAFSQYRELVLSCYDAESCGEVWSREAKINAGGTPWLRITSENDALSNAIICTLGNSLFITDMDGGEIANLHALSSVVEEGSNDISLATVYRNLSLLTEMGEIQKISTGEGPDRFDGNAAPHNHFVCRHCGRVLDLEMDSIEEINDIAGRSFQGKVLGHVTYFYGICPDCLAQEDREDAVS